MPPRLLSVRTALWAGLGLLAALGVVTALVAAGDGEPIGWDHAWQEAMADGRVPWLLAVSFALNVLGGGWVAVIVVPLVGAGLLWWRRGVFTAGFFLAAVALSAGSVQIVKNLVARPRPADMIVHSDFGSFPSGHVANAATLATVALVVFRRLAVAIIASAWVLMMAFSRTYLGAHWLSDTLAGALLGCAIGLLVATAFSRGFTADAAFQARRARGGEGGQVR